MEKSNFKDYVKIFSKLIEEEKIEVVWGLTRGGIRGSHDLDDEIENKYPDINKDEFYENAMDIIQIARLIAIGKKPKEKDVLNYEIVNDLFLTKELLEQINVQVSTSSNLLEDINYEILTKRSIDEPMDVITHTLLLNIITRDPLKFNTSNELESLSIEFTEKDLEEVIEELQGLIKKLSEVKEQK